MMGTQGGSDTSAVFNLLEVLADPKKAQAKLQEYAQAEASAKEAQVQAQELLTQAKKDAEAADKKLKDADKYLNQAAKLADDTKAEKNALADAKEKFQEFLDTKKSQLAKWESDLQEREEKFSRDSVAKTKELEDREAKLSEREEAVTRERQHYSAALNNLKVIING